jgi:hypothetical protein
MQEFGIEVIQAGFDLSNIGDWVSGVILLATAYGALTVRSLRKESSLEKINMEKDISYFRESLTTFKKETNDSLKELEEFNKDISNRLKSIEVQIEKQLDPLIRDHEKYKGSHILLRPKDE